MDRIVQAWAGRFDGCRTQAVPRGHILGAAAD